MEEKKRYMHVMSHLACITIKLEDTFQICWAICTSHLPKCRQNVSNWRSKPFSPCTWQPAFCLQKGETEQGKYCLLPHSKTDNRFPLCCQTSIQVTCSNFRQSVMPLLLETANSAAVFNAASTPVNGDIIAHIKCIYPQQKGTIPRPHRASVNSDL